MPQTQRFGSETDTPVPARFGSETDKTATQPSDDDRAAFGVPSDKPHKSFAETFPRAGKYTQPIAETLGKISEYLPEPMSLVATSGPSRIAGEALAATGKGIARKILSKSLQERLGILEKEVAPWKPVRGKPSAYGTSQQAEPGAQYGRQAKPSSAIGRQTKLSAPPEAGNQLYDQIAKANSGKPYAKLTPSEQEGVRKIAETLNTPEKLKAATELKQAVQPSPSGKLTGPSEKPIKYESVARTDSGAVLRRENFKKGVTTDYPWLTKDAFLKMSGQHKNELIRMYNPQSVNRPYIEDSKVFKEFADYVWPE